VTIRLDADQLAELEELVYGARDPSQIPAGARELLDAYRAAQPRSDYPEGPIWRLAPDSSTATVTAYPDGAAVTLRVQPPWGSHYEVRVCGDARRLAAVVAYDVALEHLERWRLDADAWDMAMEAGL
jgi:hypothetical protein